MLKYACERRSRAVRRAFAATRGSVLASQSCKKMQPLAARSSRGISANLFQLEDFGESRRKIARMRDAGAREPVCRSDAPAAGTTSRGAPATTPQRNRRMNACRRTERRDDGWEEGGRGAQRFGSRGADGAGAAEPGGPRVESYFRRKRSAKRARRGTNIGRSRRVS